MISYTSSRSETIRPTSVGSIKTSGLFSHNAQEALVSLPAFHTSIIRVRPPSLDCMNSMYCFTVGHDFFIFVQLARNRHATIHPQEPLNLFAGHARACTKDISLSGLHDWNPCSQSKPLLCWNHEQHEVYQTLSKDQIIRLAS
jgi:hypothetical protein